jgi:hypothetical protein
MEPMLQGAKGFIDIKGFNNQWLYKTKTFTKLNYLKQQDFWF